MNRPFRRVNTSDQPGDSALTRPPADSLVLQLPIEFLPSLADETWRLRKRVDRLARKMGDEHVKGIRDSLVRLQDLLDGVQVRVEDHDGRSYDSGLNLEVVHVDPGASTAEALFVIETVRPTILLQDRVIRRGQVILGSRTDGKVE